MLVKKNPNYNYMVLIFLSHINQFYIVVWFQETIPIQ